MNRYNPRIHHRRSIRLPTWDYSPPGDENIPVIPDDNNIGFRVSSTLNSRNSAVMETFQSAEACIGVQSASGHGGSPCEEKPARRGLVGNERPRRARRVDAMECVPPIAATVGSQLCRR